MADIGIQRVPKGLLEILGAFGGQNPANFSNDVRGVLNLEQFYARAQLIADSNQSNIAQGAQVAWNVPAWGFVIAVSMEIVSTATMTAYAGSIRFANGVAGVNLVTLAHGNWNDGGLGAAREFTICEFVPALPFLMRPGQRLVGELDSLGVDATALCSIQVLFGALG